MRGRKNKWPDAIPASTLASRAPEKQLANVHLKKVWHSLQMCQCYRARDSDACGPEIKVCQLCQWCPWCQFYLVGLNPAGVCAAGRAVTGCRMPVTSCRLTVAGRNRHAGWPAGAPAQASDTDGYSLLCGVTLSVSVAAPPGAPEAEF